jgi:hypothetical protein
LAEHAAEIRALGKRAVRDVIEIGRLLNLCRDELKEEGRWLAWLKNEFDWSRRTAENYINVYVAFGLKDAITGEVANFATFDVPISALYLISAPSTPKEVRTEVIARAEAGEKVLVEEVKRVVARSKFATRARSGAVRQRSPGPVMRRQPAAASLNSLSWAEASNEERQRFVSNVGIESLWSHAPAEFRTKAEAAKPVATSLMSPQWRAHLQVLVDRIARNIPCNLDVIELLDIVKSHLLAERGGGA